MYKYSICCDKQSVASVESGSGSRILGWIHDFERYSLPTDDPTRLRKIWKYNWNPVEIWLKDEIQNLQELKDGITYDIVAEQGPFAVVKLPTEGVTLEAWNLNELNNESDIDRYNLGPGYNAVFFDREFVENDEILEGEISSQHYIPVGGRLIQLGGAEEGVPLDPSTNATLVGTCALERVGHLVELFEIPSSLSVLQKTEDPEPTETIYLFNTENAIDGYCLPCVLGDLQEL